MMPTLRALISWSVPAINWWQSFQLPPISTSLDRAACRQYI
jgi:hypothetical protein